MQHLGAALDRLRVAAEERREVTRDRRILRVREPELRQADEAKVADEMDLKSVKQLVVTYGGGWIDFWVANVGFYRKQ